MFLSYLILLTALCLSAVAAFYSIVGLTAIFAAAVIPIIIMGGILEVAKLVVTVWLHEYWPRVKTSMKIYLTSAVVILMFITSMGIFGFLSKAHIQQTAQTSENQALIEQIESEIAREQARIARAEEKITAIQVSGTGADQNIQAQIDREQQRINSAYDRIQPAIDDVNRQLERNIEFFSKQVDDIDQQLDQLSRLSAINTADEESVKRLQALVGSTPDGAYGPGTARSVRAYKENLETDKANALSKIEQLKSDANQEISRLRTRAEGEIDNSNELISRLRGQLGQDTGTDIETEIAKQTQIIQQSNTTLDSLTEEKFALEAEYRVLEAEVGPVKYIAEVIYGEADKNLLEEAVRWVIIIIVFVFDPLAVMMLLAATESIGWKRSDRARQITQPNQEPEQPDTSTVDRSTITDTGAEPSSTSPRDQNQSVVEPHTTVEESFEEIDNYAPEFAKPKPQWYEENDDRMDIIGQNGNDGLHYAELDSDYPGREHELELYEEIYQETTEPQEETVTNAQEKYTEYASQEILEQDEPEEEPPVDPEKVARRVWKTQNPDQTIKEQESLYERGVIEELPWDDLAAKIDSEEFAHVDFGTQFPSNPSRGDTYIRVDYLPTKLFKYNGAKWIEIDKNVSDSFTYNDDYIEHLIQKVGSGEYDPDLLNDNERDQIEQRLRNDDI